MDYLGLIGFCIGLGWIPILIIVAPIYVFIDRLRREKDER